MIYLAVAVLLVTGIGWLVADWMKDAPDGEAWQEAGATFLMLHGGTSMLTLMLLGALVPLHVDRAWRARKNIATGILVVACNGVLVGTAFALYYFGSEAVRPWSSGVHTAFGLGLPLALLLHIKVGRKRAGPRDPAQPKSFRNG